MSYSVNFSDNAGKIVLEKVVIGGIQHTPPPNTVVFTKDLAGNLMKNTALDLTGITYTPTVTPGAGVVPPVAGVVPPVAPTAQEEALQKAQIAISIAISSARTYKDAKFPSTTIIGGGVVPTVDPEDPIAVVGAAIAAVGEANKLVEVAIKSADPAIKSADLAIKTKYEEKKIQLDAINTTLTALNELLNKFKIASPSELELETAIEQVKTTHNVLFTSNLITGGAPLRFGSSSSKTKRNRRRNRRFAKKSYKRRH